MPRSAARPRSRASGWRWPILVSRWTAATREAGSYAYSTNYLIDLDHAVIVDVEATTSVR